MSLASVKNMLTVTVLTERLKTQHHLMKLIFLILLSFDHITDIAAECAHLLGDHLCTKYFNREFQVTTVILLGLTDYYK